MRGPQDAQQDVPQEHYEKKDTNWRRTLPQRHSQRLASAQRHDAIRASAKEAVLASVQANIDSVVHTDACCHIRQYSSQQQKRQGKQPHQGGSQKQEQRQQQQNFEGPAAATAVRKRDKAAHYDGPAVTDGEMQLRSFGCMCCVVWNVMTEAVRPLPSSRRSSLQTRSPCSSTTLHLGRWSAMSATAFCAFLSKTSDRPTHDRILTLAYQR